MIQVIEEDMTETNLHLRVIKAEMMTAIMDIVESTLEKHRAVLTSSSVVDIVFSCAIMFAREIITNIAISSDRLEQIPGIVNCFNDTVDKAVMEGIQRLRDNPGMLH